MSSDPDPLELARREAEGIVREAKQQAEALMQAAEERRKAADQDSEQMRAAGRELATNLERSIALLQQILDELKSQLA